MYKIIKNALVYKGKCVGMAIGLATGLALGYAAAAYCCSKSGKCSDNSLVRAGKKMKDKVVKCSSDIVEGVVDTAGKIKNTMYCDCDDNGACRIPEYDSQDAE